MTFSPTSEQEAISAAVGYGLPHLQVRAGAGTGKTTTMAWVQNNAEEVPTLACAFNRNIAQALTERMPTALCKTMNGLGHGALMRYLPAKPSLEQDKLWALIRDKEGPGAKLDQFAKTYDLLMTDIVAVCRAARNAGLVPDDAHGADSARGLVEDSPEAWFDLADWCDVEYDLMGKTVQAARELLMISIHAALTRSYIDFDDQLYIPVLWGAPFRRFERVLVDEFQDLTPLQHRMIDKMLARDGQLVAVGDPNQAIYAFRGALSNSMELAEAKYEMDVLPLMTSFRCPKAVVRHANRLVPDLRAAEENSEGEILRHSSWELTDFHSKSLVLCRNNAPLFGLAMRMLRARLPVTMLGRDIGQGLIKTIKAIGKEVTDLQAFVARLDAWEEKEVANRPHKEGITRDRASSIRALSEGEGLRTTSDLISVVEELFKNRAQAVTLSSVHRAKGTESPDVTILDPWLMPSQYARSDEAKQQEANLEYVAITRSMNLLHYRELRDCKA